jgi:ATP-dependent Clp protease protease subunit
MGSLFNQHPELNISTYSYLAVEGVDIINRNIYLNVIEEDAPLQLKNKIKVISTLSNDNETPINLYISTFGGDAYGALGIIDIIKTASMPINTVGVGPVFSAGGLILITGTGERILSKNAILMVHQLQLQINETTNVGEMSRSAEHVRNIQAKAEQILAEHSLKSKAFWTRRLRQGDFYMRADEALSLGLIDKIGLD